MAVVTKDESPVSIPLSKRTGKGKRIYEALKDGAKTINEIAKVAKLPASSVEDYINDHEDDFITKKKNHEPTYRLKNS
jgi:Fic family protein